MAKADYSISKQMQNDLIKAYCQSTDGAWTYDDAYQKACKIPAPRYYVTAKQAYQVIIPMLRGNFKMVNKMRDNRKRMYYSIFQKVLELSEKRNFAGKSLWQIIPYAVSSPAPEFFISPISVGRIRRWMKQGIIDDEGRTSYGRKAIRV